MNTPTNEQQRLWTRDFVLLSLSCLFLFLAFEMLMPALPVYIAQIGGTTTEIGVVMGCFTISAVLIRPFSGHAAGKRGKKRLLVIGGLMCLIATGFYYAAVTVLWLLLIRFLHGFGFGIATTLYGTMASDLVPPSRMGEGMGYFGLANTVAVSIGPFVGVVLMEQAGYGTLIVVSTALLACACLFNAALKAKAVPEAAPPAEQARSGDRSLLPGVRQPQDEGTVGGEAPPGSPRRPAADGSALPLAEAASALPSSAPASPGSSAQAAPKLRLIERRALFPSLLGMMSGFGFGGILSFIALYGKEIGVANIGYFFLVASIFEVLIRFVSGRLFDRKGPYWVVAPSALLACASTYILSYAQSTATLLVAAALFGMGFGAMFPALQAWVINRVDAGSRGSATATFFNLFDVGVAGGAALLGVLAEWTGYSVMYRLSCLFYVALIVLHTAYALRGRRRAERRPA